MRIAKIAFTAVLLQALPMVHPSSFAATETEKAAKESEPAPNAGGGKKVLWDRLETPDLPKTSPAAEPSSAPVADTDKERIEKLEEAVEGLKKRLTAVEGKVAIQGQQMKEDSTP